MQLHLCRPSPALRKWIDRYWICEGYLPLHELEYKLPDAHTSLIFNLRHDRLRIYGQGTPDRYEQMPGAIAAGPKTSRYWLNTACQNACLGIEFKPGGAHPFLGGWMSVLQDGDIPLQEAIKHPDTVNLRCELSELSVPMERFQRVEQFLIDCLARQIDIPRGHSAVAAGLRVLAENPAAFLVRDMADLANLSAERFIQLFKRETGLTPKQYAGVVRFQRAVEHLRRKPEVDSLELALACGYYDQPHFNRDFRLRSGMTPKDMLRRRDIVFNHVPV
ncbi:helix-turn-helix domain-containing protein [Paenibacillus mesophilus]|uniref:helix-turn-helix domain-containing protein n=1 Tax=Paenibacillus mesophilus TaxID=2582849 RepID=UPI00130517D4|nr:helix-turn-helix domain-containing protein [Paenibacillus mesophilus]